MNTLSRVDTYLSALLSSSIPPPTPPTITELKSAHAATNLTHIPELHLPPLPLGLGDAVGVGLGLAPSPDITHTHTHVRPTPIARGRRRRRKPTAASIKLPPPSTPFFLRIALALWSILLSVWRSLVGEIRAERVERRRRTRAGVGAGVAGRAAGLGLGMGVGKGAGRKARMVAGGGAGGASSDEGSGSGTEAEGEGDVGDTGDWVDPVTRAPAGGGLDEPDEEEFAMGASGLEGADGSTAGRASSTVGVGLSTPPSKKAEPDAISFRLRSAEKARLAESDAKADADTSTEGATSKHEYELRVKPPTPQKTLPSTGILSNPLPLPLRAGPNIRGSGSGSGSGTSTPPRNRLLANPIQTSLLDPSVPVPASSGTSTPDATSTPPPAVRPHHTPFHLQKTLILDLDETLIHSTSRPMPGASAGGGMLGLDLGVLLGGRKSRREGHTVEVVIGGRSTTYHVYKRPYVDQFLKKVASWYTLVIYTASMPEYADPVIDWLDAGRSLFAKRLYRDSCFLQTNGSYIKDLALVERDLSRVCFMDNSPVSYAWNKANALPIEGWTHDPYDEALLQSLPVLDCLRFVNDVRRILGIRGFV